MKYAENKTEDYEEGRKRQIKFRKGANGQQSGDPAKLAEALLRIINRPNPPKRFLAGFDAVITVEQVITTLAKQTDAYRVLSSSLGY